jgi:hypothetical protein
VRERNTLMKLTRVAFVEDGFSATLRDTRLVETIAP